MTLKSGLEVTQDHSNLVPFESLGAVSYSPSIATMALSYLICDLIFTSDPDMIDSVNALGTFGSSDHNMLQWDIKVGMHTTSQQSISS